MNPVEVTVKPTRIRYVVLFGLCMMAGIAYVQRGVMGSAETTIRAELGVTKAQTGEALEIFFLTYALFQIPTGLLVDRWGSRKSLLFFGMLSAITLALGAGVLLVGPAAGITLVIVSRALMGVAQAGLFPAATRCFATWFPVQRRAFATGFFQAFMSIGGASGAFIAGSLLVAVKWPWLFVIFAVPGVIWSIWFFIWYRNRPDEHRSTNEAERELLRQVNTAPRPKAPGGTPWLKLATRPKLFWLCSSQFFRASANVFWMSTCATFLQEAYKVDVREANQLTSIPFIGVVIGSLGGGLLADYVLSRTGSKRRSRNGVAISTALIGVCFFVISYFTNAGPYVAIALLFLAATFASGANSCSYSVTIDIGGRFMAVVFGAMNMMGNIGAFFFAKRFYLPWTDRFGIDSGPLLMAMLYLLGAICWCFVNPNGTILDDEVETVPAR